MTIKEIKQKHFHQASIGEGSKVSDCDITWLINQNDALTQALKEVIFLYNLAILGLEQILNTDRVWEDRCVSREVTIEDLRNIARNVLKEIERINIGPKPE